MSDRLAIETVDVWKRYGSVEALRGLTLNVPAGSIFGFLGRNGAGKTTTIKVLLGMARADRGETRVLGAPAGNDRVAAMVRTRIGFVSDEKDLYGYMTVAEMIGFTRGFFPGWRADLEQKYRRQFALPLERGVNELSRGMRTKLALLLALCRGAELLMLDEPTAGLDPAMSEEVLQALVGHAASDGSTVFFSSHQLAEVEQIADHIAIIDEGRTVVAGALEDLCRRFQRIQLVFEMQAPTARFRSPNVIRSDTRGRVITIVADDAACVIDEVRALSPASIDTSPMTLKDIFLESVRTEA